MQTSTATRSEPIVQKKDRRRAVLGSLERLAARVWVPLESLAVTARSKLRFSPRVALADSVDQIEVVVEVPGVEATELDVAIDGSTLTIRGARSEQRETHGKDYYRMERYSTGFERNIRLRSPIDPNKVAATLKNGVLDVRLPKANGGNGTSHRVEVPVRAA
jgi:HSP20 family protein